MAALRNRYSAKKQAGSGILILAAGLMLANSTHAFNMGNMANPFKWMGGNNDSDRYDDYRGGPGYGYGGGPAYGAPGAGSNDAEIMQWKERLMRLEEGVR